MPLSNKLRSLKRLPAAYFRPQAPSVRAIIISLAIEYGTSGFFSGWICRISVAFFIYICALMTPLKRLSRPHHFSLLINAY